ncbi:MAG: hypothetical protein R3F17_00130 [Planctomycetota bacterium]
MKHNSLLLLPLLLASCASTPSLWDNGQALSAETLEVQVDTQGRFTEVEYHISPAAVPKAVHNAMNKLHPGGGATGAEREYVDGKLCWELTKTIDGREIEAMFWPDGTLHSEEIQIAATDVPTVVVETLDASQAGDVTSWESIAGNQQVITEYHAKVHHEGRKYKVAIAADGRLLSIVREVVAEIEVPVK